MVWHRWEFEPVLVSICNVCCIQAVVLLKHARWHTPLALSAIWPGNYAVRLAVVPVAFAVAVIVQHVAATMSLYFALP